MKSLQKRLETLEAQNNAIDIPFDCRNLFHHYMRGEILSILKGDTSPFRLVIEDQTGLSPEAREFLSLPAEGQAQMIDLNTPGVSEAEAYEIRRDIIKRLN